MRARRLVLGGTAVMILAASLAVAQQEPIFGCRAAFPCRTQGIYPQTGNANDSVLFGVGARFGPGFHFRVVTPRPGKTRDEETPRARIFRNVSLWPPAPTPTPAPPAGGAETPQE